MCGSLWNKQNADVVCRELGYSLGAQRAYSQSARYFAGPGVVWLDRVQCTGSESSLKKCPHAGYGATSCSYYQYAAVNCKVGIFEQFGKPDVQAKPDIQAKPDVQAKPYVQAKPGVQAKPSDP